MRIMTAPLFNWQRAAWPSFTVDHRAVAPSLSHARRAQGRVEGKAASIGIGQRAQLINSLIVDEAVSTSAIEGEKIDPAAVRSSIARQLGLADAGPRLRHVDGLVEVISDATRGFDKALDHDRLFRWQSALFPGGTSGLRRIKVGAYRDHADPMQIVSGAPGREVVHFEAPPSRAVESEMSAFIQWFNETAQGSMWDGITRAAIAHLWFESIHPFEDGNGRIGRAIVDMAIAQDLGEPTRLFSLSQQLLAQRAGYYGALNAAQRGSADCTDWVRWFASQFAACCERSSRVIDAALEKARFWTSHSDSLLNERQRKVVQRLLDDGDGGFLGGLDAAKYIKMTGTSKPTATRDLAGLVQAGLLFSRGQGKAVRYFVDVPGWTHDVDK
jgi:Fic family protein